MRRGNTGGGIRQTHPSAPPSLPRTQAQKEAEEITQELNDLLSQPTLDDIFVVMLVKNLKVGKTWANYQSLKDFFAELKSDSDQWASEHVQEILDQVYPDDIDHMMTRVMGLSGLVTYYVRVGDDYLYMSDRQAEEAMKWYDRVPEEDKRSLDIIASRYGDKLEELGR